MNEKSNVKQNIVLYNIKCLPIYDRLTTHSKKQPSIPGTTKFWAGVRKGSHGAGTLALPGGHLEMYESWEDCAKREIKEEMDLELDNDVRFGHVTNDIMADEEKHYVTIFMMATPVEGSGPPKNMEPDKSEGWEAYSWEDVKAFGQGKLFGPLAKLMADEPEAVYEYIHSDVRMGRRKPLGGGNSGGRGGGTPDGLPQDP